MSIIDGFKFIYFCDTFVGFEIHSKVSMQLSLNSYDCDTFGGPESCDNHHSRAVTHYGASLIIKINYRGCDTFRVLCDTHVRSI